MQKNHEGITLIALIITIIVMIILVGVTVTVALNGGLFDIAKQATEEQIISEEKELIVIAYSDYQMTKINNSDYTMQDALDNENINATAEGDEILGWIITFEETGHQYTLYGDGTINEGIADRWDGETIEEPVIAEDNSWHIYNSAQMKFFADFVNGELTEEEKGDLTITEETIVYLEADLDLGARADEEGEIIVGTEWTPVGISKTSAFVGTFEGNNHYITGIYVNIDENFAGLFGNANTIKNLTIQNSYIKGENCSGGIVGAVRNGTIENCHNVNTIVIANEQSAGGITGQLSSDANIEIINCSNSGSISGNTITGGVVGYVGESATVSNCYNTGSVTGSGEETGGVVGYIGKSSVVSECYNTGSVIGEGDYTGGVVGGANSNSSISNCYNTGSVIGEGDYTGGVVGYVGESATVSNCYNSGSVTGNGNYTGGVVGLVGSSATVSNCYNTGSVTGNGDRTGGIVGNASYDSLISDCYNTANIKGTSNVGGCAGIIFGSVENCYNTGNIEATEGEAGGVIGQTGAGSSSTAVTITVKNCYNTGDVTAPESVGGIIGWMSETNTSGTIENIYNSGKVEGDKVLGGLIGRHGMTITVTRGYNKGEVVVREGGSGSEVGALIGQKRKDTSLDSYLYYIDTIDLPAFGNVYQATTEEESQPLDTVTSVSDDINSFEEFLTWIEQK